MVNSDVALSCACVLHMSNQINELFINALTGSAPEALISSLVQNWWYEVRTTPFHLQSAALFAAHLPLHLSRFCSCSVVYSGFAIVPTPRPWICSYPLPCPACDSTRSPASKTHLYGMLLLQCYRPLSRVSRTLTIMACRVCMA